MRPGRLAVAAALALAASACSSTVTSPEASPTTLSPPALSPSRSPTASGSASAPLSPSGSPSPTAATLLAVGDVGDCRAGGDRGVAVAALAARLRGPILLLGDIAYPDGTQADYDRCFWPAWEPLKSRTRAVIGNHDDRNRSVFYANWSRSGTSGQPWYSYPVGSWVVVVVDANCSAVSCAPSSSQLDWLRATLADNASRCTLLASHQPRFSSDDEHGDAPELDAIWRTAVAGGVDLVVAGHAHDYERVGPLGANGKPSAGGPVLLIVGTGGGKLRGFAAVTPASRVRVSGIRGLAELTLDTDGWQSAFRAAPSGTVRDRASGTCH